MRKTKVQYRKLGREWCYAIVDEEKKLIEIDSRIRGIRRLKYLIHEVMHIQNPDWSETKVLKKSAEMAKIIWNQRYRRTELDAKKD